MSAIEVDDKDWPIVRLRFPESVSDEEMQQFLVQLKKYRYKGEPYAIVVDISHGKRLSPAQRKMQAEASKQDEKLIRRHCRGVAFVVQSAVVRGVLTAVQWLGGFPCPRQTFGTNAEAEQWVRAKLTE